MCIRLGALAETTSWDNLADALKTAEIMPCGRHCGSNHVVAWSEHGVAASRFFTGQRPTTFAEQLAELYRPLDHQTLATTGTSGSMVWSHGCTARLLLAASGRSWGVPGRVPGHPRRALT